jgi:hypothetical protein
MGTPLRPREAAHSPVPRSTTASERAADRAVLTFLQRDLLPELERDHRAAAVRGVHRALRLGTLEPLQALSPTVKNELLGTLEARVGRSSRPGPSVVVRLIASLELTPSESPFSPRGPVAPLR